MDDNENTSAWPAHSDYSTACSKKRKNDPMLEQAETQRKTEPATGCQLFTIELIDHSTVSASSEKGSN